MANKVGPPGSRPHVAPRKRASRAPSRAVQDSFAGLMGHLDEAHALAHELCAAVGRHTRQALSHSLVKVGQLKDALHDAIETATTKQGPQRAQALGVLSQSVASLSQQLGHTPFARELGGIAEQLAALMAQEGMSSAARERGPARPLPSIPQGANAPPPRPPKVPLQRSGIAKRERTPSPEAQPNKLDRPPSQRATAEKAAAFRAVAERQHGNIEAFPDGLRLSRTNDTPEAQRANRSNYIRSLASSSVYGGALEARVMAEMLGIELHVHLMQREKPILSVPAARADAPVARLVYQPDSDDPRLSHYDAVVAHQDGSLRKVPVPGDGNCMFYSVAVATNYRNAREIIAAREPNELRALRARYDATNGKGRAENLSDESVRRILLADIAGELRGRVAQALRGGHYDEQLDMAIVSTLADAD